MLREIAVKTLTGRGKIPYFYEEEICVENNVSKTLGCWIINLKYSVVHENNETYIEGSYSIQLWYAFNDDKSSSVYEKEIKFKEKAMMVFRNLKTVDSNKDYKVYVNKYPNAVYMKLNDDNRISLKIEALYFIDVFEEAIVIVETKENVKADLTLEEEMLLSIDTNYLTNNKK